MWESGGGHRRLGEGGGEKRAKQRSTGAILKIYIHIDTGLASRMLFFYFGFDYLIIKIKSIDLSSIVDVTQKLKFDRRSNLCFCF